MNERPESGCPSLTRNDRLWVFRRLALPGRFAQFPTFGGPYRLHPLKSVGRLTGLIERSYRYDIVSRPVGPGHTSWQ